MDFLEGEWGAQQVLGEALAAFGIAGANGLFPAVDVKAAVFPGEEIGDLFSAEVFFVAEDLEEAMAEEFGDGGEAFLGHGVEAPFLVEQAVGSEDMEMRVEDEVVAEGVDGGSGGEASGGQTEAGAEGVAQGLGGGLEKEVKEVPALAEDAAEHFRDGEDELAVRDVVADGGGDPFAGLAGAALVAGGTEVAGLAGEGEELFVAAGGAMETGEAGGEIAAPEEGADGGDGIGAQGTHGAAVVGFVGGEEVVPGVVDELPEGRGARAARVVDGGHDCPWEHPAGQHASVRRRGHAAEAHEVPFHARVHGHGTGGGGEGWARQHTRAVRAFLLPSPARGRQIPGVSYTVFARKYRPQTFDEVVGQDHIVRTLKNAIAQNRLAQAYLFVGPRGTGKTSSARIFAKALNCINGPTADPCGVCPMCREIAEGTSLNVMEFDAASNTQVDKIREIIIDNVKYMPTGGAKYKLYIVDEVHMLSNSSFNALLKTLEEPPAHVKFVFATTDVQKVPTTIISRCQRFDLRRIPAPEIAKHLLYIAGKENLALAPAAAETIARGAEGGLRDAESMLDQLVAFCGTEIGEENVLEVFGFTGQQTVAGLCEHLIAAESAKALAVIHAQAEAGKDLSRLMADLIGHLRNLLVVQHDPQGVQDELSAEATAALAEQSGRISTDKLLELIEQFAQAENRMKWAANKKMHFEIAAIRAIQTLGQATLTEVLDTLSAIRGGGVVPEKGGRMKDEGGTPRPAPVAKTEMPAAPAPRASLSAAVAASLGEKKPAPAPATAKVREEPPAKPAEKSVAAAPAAPAVSAAELWPQFVARVRKDRPLISGWIEAGQLADVTNGVAILAFPPDAGLALESCERANNRQFIEAVLSELAGQSLILKCEKRAGLTVKKIAPAETPADEPPADPMAAFKDDPLIRKALEIFQAEIL
jgi:DNA polymerase-3 subunit gamma/tau